MLETSTPIINELARRLIIEFEPEQIYLFGSQAWGAPGKDSDIDVLVIVTESTETPIARAIRGYRALGELPTPIDVLVKTRAEFERYRTLPASLEYQIVKKGRLLYDRRKAAVGAELADEGTT